jgi:hypothetical protein
MTVRTFSPLRTPLGSGNGPSSQPRTEPLVSTIRQLISAIAGDYPVYTRAAEVRFGFRERDFLRHIFERVDRAHD